MRPTRLGSGVYAIPMHKRPTPQIFLDFLG